MTITPQDIHHKEFKSARFGGYNEEEVDAFLDLVADELERLIHANEDLSQQLEAARKRVQEFEEMQNSLQNALLTASKAAEVMKEQARQESESLLEKAREEYEAALNRSREQARELISKAQAERTKIEREITRLREIRNSYIVSLRELAASHLREAESVIEGKESQTQVISSEYSKMDTPIKEVMTEELKPASTIEPTTENKSAPVEITRESKTETNGIDFEDNKEAQKQSTEVKGDIQEEKAEVPVEKTPDSESSSPNAEENLSAQLRTAVEHEPTDQHSQEKLGAGPEEDMISTSSLIDEILGVEGEENPYIEVLGNEGEEKEQGKRGRIFRREKKERDLFWE